MTPEGRSKLQEGEVNQEIIIIHLNANLNKYCKIDIYNLNVKITLIWGQRPFKRKELKSCYLSCNWKLGGKQS